MRTDLVMLLRCIFIAIALTSNVRCDDDYCPETGITYLPHYSNCTKFFECDNGVKILMYCPKNFAWNNETQECVDKEDADCSFTTLPPPTTTPQPDAQQCPPEGTSFMPHLADCSKYFECEDGNKTLQECPEGKAWNTDLNACDFEKNVDCSYTTEAPSTTPSDFDSCPDEGVRYIPNFGDCTLFYECRDGLKSEKTCPEYYAFDIGLEACVEEQYVDCSYTTVTPSSTTGWTPDPLCPYPSTISTYYADPYNCSLFYECRNGIRRVMECPSEYKWDYLKKECLPEDQVDCSYTSVMPITTTEQEITSTSGPETTTPGGTSAPIPPPSGLCTSQPDGTLLAHPYDCTRYIECVGGIEIVYPCPRGTSWDESQKACNTNNDVNCKDISTPITQITLPPTGTTTSRPGTTTPIPTNACTNQPDGTFLRYSGDCTKFIVCESGREIIYQCATGTSWNENKKSCDDNNAENCKDNSTTTSVGPTGITTKPTGLPTVTVPSGPTVSPSPTSCTGQPNGAFLPFPGNCTRFIVCEDEEEIVYQCATGTSWNVNKNECDDNNDENCNNGSTTPKPTGTTTKPTGTTTKTTRPTGSTTPRTTIVPPDVNTCKGQADGTLLPYPNDSHKYIECISGIPVVYPCPNGGTWDNNSKSCS